jgi:hypothetical protein
MSGEKVAADYCEAIEGEFAWFSQLCMKTATATHLDEYGDEFSVCDEHEKNLLPEATS